MEWWISLLILQILVRQCFELHYTSTGVGNERKKILYVCRLILSIKYIWTIDLLRNLESVTKQGRKCVSFCMLSMFKGMDNCPIEINKGLTDKGQFQYLTNLKGPQVGNYLYTTQILSLRYRSIFYHKLPNPFMGPLYCPCREVIITSLWLSFDLPTLTPGESHNEWYQYYC